MESKYDFQKIDEKIYEQWEKNGAFKPSYNKEKKPFCIVMPPPNVTGQLHMGHALDETLQDIFVRYHRMNGEPTLWIPGCDHASIATEVKVVEALAKEGKTKEKIGREGFLKQAWIWKEKYGGRIEQQLRKLGSSCDWSHERFTMDEGFTKAVEYVFCELYKKGYIYKGERIVNWCTSCHTSISDNEVEYEEEPSHLWHIKYETEDGNDGIIVATTRPETMLGDTAVAINPQDERYTHFIGKYLKLPLMNTRIPVIADDYVEKDFGTGAVKITPAHDPNDYEVAKRHALPLIRVIGEDGNILQGFGKYSGMSRIDARKAVVDDLKKSGYLVKVEDYTHNVGHCYRCHTTVEPYASSQWFVKMDKLALPAIEAVNRGQVNFVPKRFEKIYFNWMENIRDWCISRQLWWGHRIPAYYCDKCGKIEVSVTKMEKCDCGGDFHQDEDVLDTWFSSALWPFGTLGWPEKTKDYEYFYPTTMLVTGYDIITFWVSKMIFSGIEHTAQVPFKDVYIHGLVRDAQGRKMSKSLGNGIDPLEIIEQYGADALRFSLVQGIALGNDIRFVSQKVEAGYNFANKLWNAAKFVYNYIEKQNQVIDIDTIGESEFAYEEKWILTKLSECIESVDKNIANYEIGIALSEIYDFVWFAFCDKYIEMEKSTLYTNEARKFEIALSVTNYVLMNILKLLQPYMPFITEEIHRNILDAMKTEKKEFLMMSAWPKAKFVFNKETNVVDEVQVLLSMLRNQLNDQGITKKINAIVYSDISKLDEMEATFKKLGKLESVEFKEEAAAKNDGMCIHTQNIAMVVDLTGVVNVKEQDEKRQAELIQAKAELARAQGLLSNYNFVAKAPKEKIELEKSKVEKYMMLIEKLSK